MKIKKTLYVCAVLLMWAGALFLCAGMAARVPADVTVNGVRVGRLSYRRAYERLLRDAESKLSGRRLRICAGDKVYEFVYPELGYEEDFMSALRSAERGQDIIAPAVCRLEHQKEIIERICAACFLGAEDNEVVFNKSGQPFTYVKGRTGRVADEKQLASDIKSALEDGTDRVEVRFASIAPEHSMDELKSRTKEISSFSTQFDASNKERAHNIALAAQKLNGAVIPAGGVLSFNAAVGERTAENGFELAKIISEGKFVPGYGGGVCQVSTTLYNAALLGGLGIAEYHPHSLQVGYVPPSRDAMVSGDYFDLKIKNTRSTPVYIRAFSKDGTVGFTLYGSEDGCEYSLESQSLAVIPTPQPVVVEGEEDKVLSPAREGLTSCCYLVIRRGGEEVRQLLREDEYAAVAEVRVVRRQSAKTAKYIDTVGHKC